MVWGITGGHPVVPCPGRHYWKASSGALSWEALLEGTVLGGITGRHPVVPHKDFETTLKTHTGRAP